MTIKLYLAISSVVAFVYGVGFVLLPSPSVQTFGVSPEPHLDAALQFFGAVLIAQGLIFWFGRDFELQAARRVIICAVVGDVIGTALLLLDVIQGLINRMAWGSILINLLLIAGGAYLLYGVETKSAFPRSAS
jgi:hypothetical protein